MAWLLAHIWAALAGVAVFGLLLGWSIRGMLLVGKMRRATVERDITMTELEQAKDEIERLYAAQRGKPIGGGDINIREELAEREVKISRLANELERAKKQLEDLKDRPEPPKAAASFAPRSLSEAVASDPAPALVWRNRHLESRVRHLENLIEQGVAVEAPAAQETAPQAALSTGAEADPTEVGLAADAAPETGADTAKEEWQVGFLRQRVEALEDQLIKAESEAKQALEAADAAKAEAAAQPAEAPAPAAPAHTPREGEVEEELARLRWRNRFLEGRLAYFEGDAREALEEPAAAVVAEEETADTLPAEAIPEERPNFGFQADEPVAEEEPPVAIAPAFGALEEVTPAEDETHAEDEVQAEEDLPAEEAEAEEIEPEAAEPEMADLEEADLEDNMPDEAEPEEDVGASDEEPVTVADVFEETVGADTEEEVSGEDDAAVEDETSDAAEEVDDETEDDAPPVASSEEASRAILAALELDDEDETDEDAAEDDDTESDDELDADAEGEETDVEDDEEAYDEDSDDDEDYDDSEDDEDFDEDEDESDDDEDYDSDDEDEDDYEDEDEDFDEDDEDFEEDEDDESDYDDEDADEEDGDDSLDDEDDESDEEEGEDLYAEDDRDEAGEAPDEDVYAETEEESDAEEDEAEDDGPVGTAPNALDKPVAGHADDLTVIGGIGPKIQELLNGMGIWHYEQIAAWTPDNIAWVDRELNFSGRIVREGWVEQAAILAGDMAEEDA